MEAFDDNSMPDDRNTEKEKRDKNISKSLFYHEINNILQCSLHINKNSIMNYESIKNFLEIFRNFFRIFFSTIIR